MLKKLSLGPGESVWQSIKKGAGMGDEEEHSASLDQW